MSEILLYSQKQYRLLTPISYCLVPNKDESIIFYSAEHYYRYNMSKNSKFKEDMKNLFPSYKVLSYVTSERNMADKEYEIDLKWKDSSYRYKIMLRANKQKFIYNPLLVKLLLSTKNKNLIFDIPGDSFFGIGKDKNGENKLGKLLMKLRTQIKNNEIELFNPIKEK